MVTSEQFLLHFEGKQHLCRKSDNHNDMEDFDVVISCKKYVLASQTMNE